MQSFKPHLTFPHHIVPLAYSRLYHLLTRKADEAEKLFNTIIINCSVKYSC